MATDNACLTVLVVEDNDALREVMVEVLTGRGYRVIGLDCAEAVCELPNAGVIDVAVLDLNLPGEDGLSLARRLREARSDLGIIMVTARDQLSDKVSGYEHGADLYLTKPVEVQELALAIQALGRRLKPAVSRDEAVCRLDLQARVLVFAGGEAGLTEDEVNLLSALALAREQRLESWQLLERLGRELSEQGKKQLEVLCSRLRRKLKAQGLEQPVIRADRGRGYRLCLPLRLV